jgi:hypothetical protein
VLSGKWLRVRKNVVPGSDNFYVYLAMGLDRRVLNNYAGLPITEKAKTGKDGSGKR